MAGVREGSRINPDVYNLDLYYALDPWSLRPDQFRTACINVTVYATPRGRNQTSLELQLIQVSTSARASSVGMEEPKIRSVKVYLMDAIVESLQNKTGKAVRPFLWSIVDWES
jgi:hypothetical protein